MRETTGRKSRVSFNVKAAVGAVLAMLAVGAFSVSSAQAASTPGNAISAEFNYVGINVTAVGNELNDLVLTPNTMGSDGVTPLGALQMDGNFSDAAGNFTLPKDGGLTFPDLSLDLGDGIVIEAEIGLTAPATGNYNDATGAMSVNPKISLTLGTDDMSTLPDSFPISGSGPLKCQISPLNVSLSTNPTNWPAPGKAFTNKALLTDGALAGGWNTKPKVKSLVTQNAGLCPIIGTFLEPVGGLYLANSTAPLSGMPAATATKPAAAPCPAGTTGVPGTPPEDCKAVAKCPEGQTGTPPDCEDIVLPPAPKAEITKVTISGGKTLKSGKSGNYKVKVTNTGNKDSGAIKVKLKSTNSKVTLPKTVTVSVPKGKTVTKSVPVKAAKKAKGKATLSATYGIKTGKFTLNVKAAPKKKKK